jgi:phosphoribosyl 1,2-cyclic phosphate phosphodiesterase
MQVLVDTTPDLRTQALTHDVRRVDAVLFTHTHADHIMGLDEVRRYNHLSGRAMDCFGDARALAEIRRVFAYVFDPAGQKGGGVPAVNLWTLGGPFCLGRQEVVPVPVRHGHQMIFGYRLGRIAYLTDCSAIPDASFELLKDLDVLVLDALRRRPHPTHFTLDQAVQAARRVGAARTLFTHICHDLGHEATCASLPPGMALAYDGQTLDIR